MDAPNRRRAVVFVVPLILAVIMTQRISENVRTVDFLQIFACGMIVGLSLAGIIRMLRTKGEVKP